MRRNGNGSAMQQRLARSLGWFSIGLGVAEVIAPRALSRLIGTRAHPGLMRLLGFREIASGIGILTQTHPTGWVQARVGGDALDLALLGASLASSASRRGRVAAATAAVAGVTALDVLCTKQLRHGRTGAVHVRRSVTINRSPEELYQFWHRFEDLPRFMNHLLAVQKTGDHALHWVAKGPLQTQVEWDAEIIIDKPNEVIAWRSLPGADVDNAGSIRFERAHGGRGTVVRVQFEYNPPAGVLGAKAAKLFGEAPEKQVAVDLLRFKQLMETGEIARTEGQPAGRPRSTSRKYDEFVQT